MLRIPRNPISSYSNKLSIFVLLQIYNWIPEYYNDTNTLPVAMPRDLKDKITQRGKNNAKEVNDNGFEITFDCNYDVNFPILFPQLNTVWVSCEGENAADKEHIGDIHMFPSYGFPGYYFPFSNINGYVSPLVAVWFQKPKSKLDNDGTSKNIPSFKCAVFPCLRI